MFVLGFYFPAEEGNKIADEKVVAKVDEAISSKIGSVKEIKIYEGGNAKDTELKKAQLYKTLNSTDTFLAKALVNYFVSKEAVEGRNDKYLIYTDKYQISALAKNLDKGNSEILEICKKFDGMEPMSVELVCA